MDVIFVDVRTHEEYKENHKAGAVNIPVEDMVICQLGILEHLAKDTPLRLYCRSGARSEKAKETLLSYGFTDVVNIGGIQNVL